MKGKQFLVIGLILLAFVSSAVAGSLKIMTEKNPPFNFEQDGAVKGIAADLIVMAMEKIGQPLERSAIKILPWPRAYKAVQTEAGTMLFSMARTNEREQQFKWAGPIQDLTIGLVAPKAKKIVIKTPGDAGKYKIGTIREGAPEQLAIKAGIPEKAMDRIADPQLNVKKLAAGRIDMFAFNVPAAHYMMIQQHLNPDEYEVVYSLKKTALYYGFHKDTDPSLIDKINQAIKDLKKKDDSGTSPFDRIVQKYLGSGD